MGHLDITDLDSLRSLFVPLLIILMKASKGRSSIIETREKILMSTYNWYL